MDIKTTTNDARGQTHGPNEQLTIYIHSIAQLKEKTPSPPFREEISRISTGPTGAAEKLGLRAGHHPSQAFSLPSSRAVFNDPLRTLYDYRVCDRACLPACSLPLGGAAYYPVTVHRNTLLTLLLYESTVVMVL
jgi:hypothetical protein